MFQTPLQRTLRLEEQVFILNDAVATCRDSLRSFVALLEPCVGHKSSRNRHRIPRRTDIRTARRALLFLLRNMRRETAHVSRDSPIFLLSFLRLADVCLPTGDPLSQGALDGLPWALWVAPVAQRRGTASSARARPARTGTYFLLDMHVGLTSVLKVSHQHRHRHSSQAVIFHVH